MEFEARLLDDDPLLLEQSYRLRYQVYCVERQFLPVEDYPDGLERDTFDRDSIHVGAVDTDGKVVGTARLVLPNSAGFPLFRHCSLFPHETTLDEAGNLVVEARGCQSADATPGGETTRHSASAGCRRQILPPRSRRRPTAADAASEPFRTLLQAIIYGAKGVGATHMLFATDAAFHRWLVHFGFPLRLAGPEADYYGRVAPHIMSMSELDQVVLSRTISRARWLPGRSGTGRCRRWTTAMETRGVRGVRIR